MKNKDIAISYSFNEGQIEIVTSNFDIKTLSEVSISIKKENIYLSFIGKRKEKIKLNTQLINYVKTKKPVFFSSVSIPFSKEQFENREKIQVKVEE